MSKVCRVKLNPFLGEEELSQAWRRYRFDLGEGCSLDTFRSVCRELSGSLRAEACWEADPVKRTVRAAITLGREFDDRQQEWSGSGELLRAYMADCIGMELLTRASRELDEKIRRETGLFVANRRFPGEETPLEETERILGELSASFIVCNRAFVLTPKKSVVFTGELAEEGGEDGSPCAGCGSASCAYRDGSVQGINVRRG